MIDWVAAEHGLYRISKQQIAQFLNGEKDDVYGFGFFCDGFDGTVLLVANTEQHHLTTLREYEGRFGPTDPERFRWEIGNWKYPAGLFPSSSAVQNEFEDAWKTYRKSVSRIKDDGKQGMLEDVCVNVLRRLIQGRAFSETRRPKGVTILGHDDRPEDVFEKKKRLDNLFQRDDEGHDQ